MNVILTDQTVFKIKECGLELYYYDRAFTDEKNSYKTDATIIPYSLLSTVTENKEFYTHADIEGAGVSRRYQGLLCWPATSDL